MCTSDADLVIRPGIVMLQLPVSASRTVELRSIAADEDDVVARIAEVVRSLNGTVLHYEGPLSAQTNIVRDLKLDSLAVMDFVMAVETRFDTIIPVESIAAVETIGDLGQLLLARTENPVR